MCRGLPWQAQNNIFSPSRAGAPIAMAVQPEQAIKSFEEAIKLNPTDTSLASKIGKALITTHDYAKVQRAALLFILC